MKDKNTQRKIFEAYQQVHAGSSIGNELYGLYSKLDSSARTTTGSLVREELKNILEELNDIVNNAEQNIEHDAAEVLTQLIRQLKID